MLPLCILSAGTSFAQGGIPDPPHIYVSMPNAGLEDLVLFVLPDGNGSPFTEAQIRNNGALIDATIELLIHDAFDVPVAHYPREDVWLEPADHGLASCIGGTNPEQDTDDNGFTFWQNPPHAGGFSEELLYVVVAGLPVTDSPLNLGFNSADMNGDGLVSLLDVGAFSINYFGDYAFRADFHADGILDLLDVGRLATGQGSSCP